MNEASRLLLLAGPSCAGKTVLGNALRDSLPGNWLFWDEALSQPQVPNREDFITHENDLRMFEGNLRSIRAYVDSGFDVVAELYMWSEGDLAKAAQVFEGIEPLVVELRCRLDILEERERMRESALLGFARTQFETYQWMIPTDLVLDSESKSVERLAAEVKEWLATRPRPRGLMNAVVQ